MSPSGGADLSPEAIRARRHAKARTGRDGGYTGRELTQAAAGVFEEAKRLAKVADKRRRRGGREKAKRKADEALVVAAVQIRLAAMCPLDRPYLHALSLEQVQNVRAEVIRLMGVDPGALAVDVHRKLREQRQRTRTEGA